MIPENNTDAISSIPKQTDTHPCILRFADIDKTKLGMVGGKGANLGELSRIEAINVPDGFCITTEVYKQLIANNETIYALLEKLAVLKADDRRVIAEISANIRKVIKEIAIPESIDQELSLHLQQLDEKNAYAVRSSATAEDLLSASFAGQQDTYLNITGKKAILEHVSKCWASLFTDRAIIYRMQNGFDHGKVYLSVVIQKMIFPDAAGIMFTADPVNSNRKVISIDASFGLGEAMVSGFVNADNYKVRAGQIINKKVSTKKLAIVASAGGGTKEQEVEPGMQNIQTLTDGKIIELETIGRRIELYFGKPQDIEWCLVNDAFYIVQSRPITTLYPIPEASDQEKHIYVSVGHQQMMTDPMLPLGLSLFQLTAFRPMYKAAGRLFVDVMHQLSAPDSRDAVLDALGKSDPLIKDALITIINNGDFIKELPEGEKAPEVNSNNKAIPSTVAKTQIELDPAIVSELISNNEVSIATLRQNIQKKSGEELLDFILDDIQELKKILFDPQSIGVIMAAIDASLWINEKMQDWLGKKNAADAISQSVINNITSEMGLALLDLADVIRPYPEVIACLQGAGDDGFLNHLPKFNGGQQTREAIEAYLNKYGMRCAGEIDITKPRWGENPKILVPVILSNIKNFAPGEGKRRFEQGLQDALEKKQELLDNLKQLPDAGQKIKETKRMIGVLRDFIGYREYPKYGMVNRYFVYKQALLHETEQLLRANAIREKEDIYYLTFEELRKVVQTHKSDYDIITRRKAEYKLYEKLTPSRVITSDGEIITGEYKREELPAGAIAGLAVSSGVIEGRARVILKMEDADIAAGDILVTTFTDPSWTPLFISIKGLVTEVGGLMTHGAVIAREYGLPAVVGVENATKLIKDGQHIRVNGTEGYVEILL